MEPAGPSCSPTGSRQPCSWISLADGGDDPGHSGGVPCSKDAVAPSLAVRLGLYVLLPTSGPVAQLGARLNGIQEVTGSIPVRSTILRSPFGRATAGKPAHPSGELRLVSQRILRASYGWQASERPFHQRRMSTIAASARPRRWTSKPEHFITTALASRSPAVGAESADCASILRGRMCTLRPPH